MCRGFIKSRYFKLIGVLAALAALAATPAVAAVSTHHSSATHRNSKHFRAHKQDYGSQEWLLNTGSATGLGQLNGVLPRTKLTLESAIEINLSKEYARLPIYPGTAPNPKDPSQTEKVWYILEDASDKGLADDLGVNYAPKLADIGISCPECIQ